MSVAKSILVSCQLYRFVPAPVHRFHPTCLSTFYTCSTPHLSIFVENILFHRPLDQFLACIFRYIWFTVDSQCCLISVLVFEQWTQDRMTCTTYHIPTNNNCFWNQKAHSHGHHDAHWKSIQSGLSFSHECTWNPMHIECTSLSIHLRRWTRSEIKL